MGPKKERLSLLGDAFFGQWRKHDYLFFRVQRTNVTVARLTLAVAPELGVLIRADDQVAVRLWISGREIMGRERDTLIYLLSGGEEYGAVAPSLEVWSLAT